MSTHVATVLLIMTGRLFGQSLPADGVPVLTAQVVDAETCQTIAQSPLKGVLLGGNIVVASVTCGHAQEWAALTLRYDCVRVPEAARPNFMLSRCAK